MDLTALTATIVTAIILAILAGLQEGVREAVKEGLVKLLGGEGSSKPKNNVGIEAHSLLLGPYSPEPSPKPWAERPELQSLREVLLSAERHSRVVIENPDGMGKTSLATKIFEDEEIRKRYKGGVLWVNLGQEPDLLKELNLILAHFKKEISSEAGVGERATLVRDLLRPRRCLLIIDDAWHPYHAKLFRDLEPTSALLTTMFHTIAVEFDATSTIRLDPISEEESVKLLRRWAPTAKDSDLQRVAKAASGFPGFLKLIGPLLGEAAFMNLDLTPFVWQVESPYWRGELLDELRKKFLGFLSDVEGVAFSELAVFGGRPAKFDLDAVRAVWNVKESEAYERLSRLVALHLVDPGRVGEKSFSLYQPVADMAAALLVHSLDDPAPTRYIEYCQAQLNSKAASTPTTLNSIVMGRIYSDNSMWEKALVYLEQMLPVLIVQGDFLEQARALTIMGNASTNLRNEQKALNYYEQALPLLAMVGDQAEQLRLLANIVQLSRRLQTRDQALEYYQQMLVLSEAIGDQEQQADILNNIADVYDDLGILDQAIAYYQKALAVQKILHTKYQQVQADQELRRNKLQTVATLDKLGAVLAFSGEQQRALECYEDALALLEPLENMQLQHSILRSSALIYLKQAEFAKAEQLLMQVVKIATIIRHPGLDADQAKLAEVHAQMSSKPSRPDEDKNDPTPHP
jgi:tetratricopeptide (TPR) repeat protein